MVREGSIINTLLPFQLYHHWKHCHHCCRRPLSSTNHHSNTYVQSSAINSTLIYIQQEKENIIQRARRKLYYTQTTFQRKLFYTCLVDKLESHVMLTSLLPKDNPRRFSKGMHKKLSNKYAHCGMMWMEFRQSFRIIKDINRLQENLRTVYDADGAVIIAVLDRNGHRKRNEVGSRKENQVALSTEQLVLCPDYQHAVQEIHDKEWTACQQSRVNQN